MPLLERKAALAALAEAERTGDIHYPWGERIREWAGLFGPMPSNTRVRLLATGQDITVSSSKAIALIERGDAVEVEEVQD